MKACSANFSYDQRHGDRFCNEKEVRHLAGDPAKSTLRRWIEQQQFPAPYRLGAGKSARVGWSYMEIQEWIESRKAEQNGLGRV